MKSKTVTLITGASEGLGKHLALACAAWKENLALVALPGSGLQEVVFYIQQQFGVDVFCFETDLTQNGACQKLFENVKESGLSVATLINNAGAGGTYPFDSFDADYYKRLITLNAIVPTQLCRLFLEDLSANAPSHILNVSSLAGLIELPRKQVYGGTKSFLVSFSGSLRKELKEKGISVSVLCPGAMNTTWKLMVTNRFLGTWLGRRSVMEPAVVAQIAVQKMRAGKKQIIPGFWNRCFVVANRILPAPVKDFLQQYQMKKVGRMVPLLSNTEPVPEVKIAV